MDSVVGNTLVLVDAGDLDEAMQSAQAWASYLRLEKGRDPKGELVGRSYEEAADRIDQAVARLRKQQYEHLSGGEQHA